MLRLRGVEQALVNFFASGLLALGPKLGPILWCSRPTSSVWFDLLEEFFLALLPHDTHAAATLSKKHDERLKGRAYTEPGKRRSIRHAMEIRHPSFVVPEFISLLRRYNIALLSSCRYGRLAAF